MPSSWDVYYVVFLSALLALGIPVLLAFVSLLVSSRPTSPECEAPLPPPPERRLQGRINARFFLGVNASLVLVTLALALIPCAGTLRPQEGETTYIRGLIAVISLAAFAGLGLLYASRKGDLGWVESLRPASEAPRPGEPAMGGELPAGAPGAPRRVGG